MVPRRAQANRGKFGASYWPPGQVPKQAGRIQRDVSPMAALKSALSFATEKCGAAPTWDVWKDWRMEMVDEPGVLLVTVRSHVNACHYWIPSIIYEIGVATFFARSLEVSIDRAELTRSAGFLISLIVVHADGKMCVRRVKRFERLRLSLRSFVLDRLCDPGQH